LTFMKLLVNNLQIIEFILFKAGKLQC
jgi:hypothetical protein